MCAVYRTRAGSDKGEAEPSTRNPKLRAAPDALVSEDHRRMLIEESGIGAAVVTERGYRTVGRPEVPEAFGGYQRRPGLLVPMFSPDGKTTSHQLRPDAPRVRDGKAIKYETAGGSRCVLDVHPRMRQAAGDPAVPLWITEGIKKADSLTSRGFCTVGLVGVWNWQRDGALLPCWDHVALEGREVRVVFDSDVVVKPGVQLALERLVAALGERGARVLVVYLPDGDEASGEKVGVDDYLVAGGTVDDLRALARPFEPSEVGRIRLSRDEKLRAGVRWLRAEWRDRDWMRFVGAGDRANWARGHTARDVMEALISRSAESGKVDDRGIVVRIGTRRLAELAAKSAPSVAKALKHLEAEGIVEILPAEDRSKARRHRLLVPRAALYSTGKGNAKGKGHEEGEERCKGLRSPSACRLRWSSPGRSRRREFEVVPGRSVVRHGGRTPAGAVGEDLEARPYVRRLGPHRCAVLDALEAAGGELTLTALCEVLHRKRPRDVRRRILPMLEEAGIVMCEGYVVSLAADWLGKLEEERERKGEISQAERQAEKHRGERARYREHLERERRGTPEASRAAVRRTHELRERRLREIRDEDERDRAPTPPAVEALIDWILGMHDRMRVELLCEIAKEEGLRWRDVPPALRRMGYRVERLPEFGDAEFVYPGRRAA